MEALPASLLRDVAQEALGVAVIGIDEGQFVSWPVLAFCLGTPSLSLFLLCWFCLLVSNVNFSSCLNALGFSTLLFKF